MKFRLHFPGFMTSIFGVFVNEENQEALLTPSRESNFPHKDNIDEERARPAGLSIHPRTSILPTDPVFHQPGAAGLNVLESDHESVTFVPNQLCNDSSCSEQWELIPDCGQSDSESTSGEQWELIPGYGRSDSESTSGEDWELIPGYDHSGSESSSTGESSWEILANYHSDSDNDYVCVESICGDPWQMLQEPLQGPETQPKQGTVSKFLFLVNQILILSILLRIWQLCLYIVLLSKGILSLVTGKGISRGSGTYHAPSMEGLEAGRFCACQRNNVITNFYRADCGSCVRGGSTNAHSLHVINIGQNTNSGKEQTVGDVNYEEGYVRLEVNNARDVFINGQLCLNELSQTP